MPGVFTGKSVSTSPTQTSYGDRPAKYNWRRWISPCRPGFIQRAVLASWYLEANTAECNNGHGNSKFLSRAQTSDQHLVTLSLIYTYIQTYFSIDFFVLFVEVEFLLLYILLLEMYLNYLDRETLDSSQRVLLLRLIIPIFGKDILIFNFCTCILHRFYRLLPSAVTLRAYNQQQHTAEWARSNHVSDDRIIFIS